MSGNRPKRKKPPAPKAKLTSNIQPGVSSKSGNSNHWKTGQHIYRYHPPQHFVKPVTSLKRASFCLTIYHRPIFMDGPGLMIARFRRIPEPAWLVNSPFCSSGEYVPKAICRTTPTQRKGPIQSRIPLPIRSELFNQSKSIGGCPPEDK